MGAGMGEGRVSLRQEHFLLLRLYYLLHAPLFFWYGWSKEPSHQVGPILMPALWPRWRKTCNYFQRILGQSDIRQGQSESTAFLEMVADRRLYIWSTSCLHCPSSFSLNISLNIILQNHSVSFFLPSDYKHTFFFYP